MNARMKPHPTMMRFSLLGTLKSRGIKMFLSFFFFFTRNATRMAGGQQMEAGLDSEPAVGISWPYFQGSSLYIETN